MFIETIDPNGSPDVDPVRQHAGTWSQNGSTWLRTGLVWRARTLPGRIRGALRGDAGMSTAEYAMGTVAAAAFASVLYAVVTSDSVREAVTALIERGLQGGPL